MEKRNTFIMGKNDGIAKDLDEDPEGQEIMDMINKAEQNAQKNMSQ